MVYIHNISNFTLKNALKHMNQVQVLITYLSLVFNRMKR